MALRTGEVIKKSYLSGDCPLCSSADVVRTKGTPGDWVREYECNNCKSSFEFNEGDKMGGQFDEITILKDNYSKEVQEPGTKPLLRTAREILAPFLVSEKVHSLDPYIVFERMERAAIFAILEAQKEALNTMLEEQKKAFESIKKHL